jgi:hypothetical protein
VAQVSVKGVGVNSRQAVIQSNWEDDDGIFYYYVGCSEPLMMMMMMMMMWSVRDGSLATW